jgi:hypothetical protein
MSTAEVQTVRACSALLEIRKCFRIVCLYDSRRVPRAIYVSVEENATRQRSAQRQRGFECALSAVP